jgi:hypothetical protein
MPTDAREVTGYVFSAGPDRLGIGGTAAAAGKLFFRSGDTRLEGTTPVGIRTWNHVVVSRDRGKVAVFLNGRLTPEISGAAPSPVNAAWLFIGGCEDRTNGFEGKLDEVAVYGRALGAKEAAQHFRASR